MTSTKYFIACLLLITSNGVLAAEIPKFQLPYGKWRMISLPATPPDSENTLTKILGDDLGADGNYGQNWVVYAYNAESNGYGKPVLLSDTLEKGRGYWIIQLTEEGESVTLEMPKDSSVTPNELIPLTASKDGSNQWNLAGNPFSTSLPLDQLRISSNASSCSEGSCDLDKAEENNLLHNKVWIYDGDGYKEKDTSDQLAPWDGFWAAALDGSFSHSLALGTSRGIAQAKIAAYAEDNANSAPTIQDYTTAGVKGVTTENLAEVNAAVAALGKEDVNTLAKLRTVVASVLSCVTRAQLDVMIENNEDVTQVVTSCITDMSQLFLKNKTFNQDISKWDVSSVTDMSYMFYGAEAFNQDISGWDISTVTRIDAMFGRAKSFNQDIGSWNIANVTNVIGLRYMFAGAHAFNQDISSWDVSNITNMSGMFNSARTFNQDISGWDVGKVTTMKLIFGLAENFNQDLSEWDVSNVKTMWGAFSGADDFNQDISGWDVSNVTDMTRMFAYSEAFSNHDLSKWKVGKVVYHWLFLEKTGPGNIEPNWQ